ncbi:MAG: hypothetical protein WB474_13860 [Nitrososphaeraceae archaeon]
MSIINYQHFYNQTDPLMPRNISTNETSLSNKGSGHIAFGGGFVYINAAKRQSNKCICVLSTFT